jgi:hypothetical protein
MKNRFQNLPFKFQLAALHLGVCVWSTGLGTYPLTAGIQVGMYKLRPIA